MWFIIPGISSCIPVYNIIALQKGFTGMYTYNIYASCIIAGIPISYLCVYVYGRMVFTLCSIMWSSCDSTNKVERRGAGKKRVSVYYNVQYDDVYMSRCWNPSEVRGITVPIAFTHTVYSI